MTPSRPKITIDPESFKKVISLEAFACELPTDEIPAQGMSSDAAYLAINYEMELDGDPRHNLATFVTTFMDNHARKLISENLHRNFIDHAEYPQTAEIEQRCIRMLSKLYHAPEGAQPMGARCQGSSEAIMLGALAMKWRWRAKREAAGQDTAKPNLVYGADVHVVWDKFCRYFDVEPREIPLTPQRFTIGPDDVAPHIDENTIGVVGVIGTTFTGENDDIVGINDLLVKIKRDRGLDIPLHADGASGGFVMPFIYPDHPWDFRLEQMSSINVSGHKFGLVYPGIGWLIFRDRSELPEDLVFYENYLGKVDATFTLNFSTGAAMVLAQYYNFLHYGHDGYQAIIESMKRNADDLADRIAAMEEFEVLTPEVQLPLVAFTVAEGQSFTAYEVADQLARIRGWMVPAYALPNNAQETVMLRILVKENLGRSLINQLVKDIAEAVATLKSQASGKGSGPVAVHTGTGY